MTDPFIGRQIGRYDVRTLLGQGGTARVYRALDQRLQRDVAIKILSDEALRDPEFIQRFDREARTLAGLRHPHIVQIYDYGQQDGLNYIITQLLPGPTLEEEVDALNARNERMEARKLLQTLTQVSSALDYAHKQGIIHRDIKPANVIRDAAGDAVLTDFGIARAAEASGVTQVGTVIGTPAYLSPEQAQGTALSPASDIYALGILAYELLTGRVPFDDPNPMSILLDQVQTPPPAPSTFRADLPVAVDQALLKALAKSPTDRFASAGAFVRALGSAWQASAPAAAPAPPHEQQTVVHPAPVPPVNIHGQETMVNPAPMPPANVHDQPTVAHPVSAQPRPQARPAPPPPAPQYTPPPPTPPADPKVYRRSPWPLIAGLLVGLVLLGGVVAALANSDPGASAVLPTVAAPTEAPPVPTEPPPPTEPPTVEPSPIPPTEVPTEPPPPPTEAPPPPTEPPPPPTEEPPELPTIVVATSVPAPPASGAETLVANTRQPLAVMQNIIEANRIAQPPKLDPETVEELLDGIESMDEEIQEGDKPEAIEELDKLWREIGEGVEQRRVPRDVGGQLRDQLLLIRGALK